MVAYVGATADTPVWASVAPSSASATLFSQNLTDHGPFALAASMVGGAVSNSGNTVFPAGAAKTGYKFTSFIDDFYDRIHIFPASLTFANLVTPTNGLFSIWNAWRVSETLNSVVSNNSTGLSLSGFPSVPHVMKPLEYSTFTLNALPDGPATINGMFTFTFNTGQSVQLTVTGSRVVVFPFKPNWATPVNETLEWKTDVLRSFSGVEQRRSLRLMARRGFEYQFLMSGKAVQKFESLIQGWHGRNFLLPVWTEPSLLTATAQANQNNIMCDTTGLSFRVNDMAVIFLNDNNYEVVQVASVTQSQIVTAHPLTGTWGGGVRIYPAMFGFMPTQIATQRLTSEVVTGNLIFSSSPDLAYSNTPDDVAQVLYDGLEVVLTKPNWSAQINVDFMRDYMVTDSGVGPVGLYRRETVDRIVRQYPWLIKSKSEMLAFRKFLQRAKGQAKSFWVPSWHGDFTMVSSVGSSDNTVTVAGTEFYNFIGVNTARDRLIFRLTDGSNLFRKIIGASVSGGNTIITLDAVFGRNIAVADLLRIHILLRCRMATDKIVIPWRTAGVADPQLTLTTVQI